MPQMVWSTQPDGAHDYYNAQWYAFTGAPAGSTDGDGWNDMFHPDDQERSWLRWQHSLATGDDYEIEYRLRHHSGAYRWTLGRALPVRTEDGTIVRWVGTCTDIDDQKRLAEQNEILSRELSHRIKNIFAVLSGLISLSVRQFPEMAQYAKDLKMRVASLGRAHDFVRPHSERSAPHVGPTTLKALLSELLSPYQTADAERLMIDGDDHVIDDRAATPFGLVFHELATNASKYGALSSAHGTVNIFTKTADGLVQLRWEETGGPAILDNPSHVGFGTRLTDISVVDQLGGTLHREWAPHGLKVIMTIPASALSRN